MINNWFALTISRLYAYDDYHKRPGKSWYALVKTNDKKVSKGGQQ